MQSHSLSKENRVSLVRTLLSDPASVVESVDLGIGGGKTILRNPVSEEKQPDNEQSCLELQSGGVGLQKKFGACSPKPAKIGPAQKVKEERAAPKQHLSVIASC